MVRDGSTSSRGEWCAMVILHWHEDGLTGGGCDAAKRWLHHRLTTVAIKSNHARSAPLLSYFRNGPVRKEGVEEEEEE